MRAFFLTLPLLPLPALADTFTLPSKATAATIYSSGALVTHALDLTLPAGTHQIVLPDLPPNLPLDFLRLAAPDLKLGAVRYRADLAPPRSAPDSPEITAAKARIAEIETRIEAVNNSAARQRLAVGAAEAQIAFLAALGATDSLPTDIAALRDVTALIGAETLAAKQAAFDAERSVRDTLRAREDLETALKDAKQALAALVPEAQDRPLLVLDVTAASDLTDTPLTVTFAADARWEPAYDLRLTLDPAPQLLIERGARVYQESGENWDGVALTLSTQQISGALEPGEVFPDLRRIFDEAELYRPALRSSGLSDAPVAAPVMAEEAMSSLAGVPQGLSVTYTWRDPVDVASGADEVRLPFDSLSLDAEIVARAAPLLHSTAFLVAKITNTTGEPLLAGRDALRFVDNGLVGMGYFDTIQAGEEAEIGFGSIDGLQLTRRILKRGEADRGILSRSNEVTEETEITLKNLTSRAWDVTLHDRVPYSEQEDLVITYSAAPPPDVVGVEDKRGVLEWRLEMAPGAERVVSTTHRITWPDGQQMR